MSFLSNEFAALTSAKQKICGVIDFEKLPLPVSDPFWDDIKSEANLSLNELCALQNARCHQSRGKDNHIFTCVARFVCAFAYATMICLAALLL